MTLAKRNPPVTPVQRFVIVLYPLWGLALYVPLLFAVRKALEGVGR